MPDSATPGTAAHQASLLYTISLNLLKLMYIESVKSSKHHEFSSVQFSSVTQSCPTLCDPMNCSMPGPPVHHQLLEFTQTHVHQLSDAIQPSILCRPLLLLPSIPPSIRVFSSESILLIRWPKYWSSKLGKTFLKTKKACGPSVAGFQGLLLEQPQELVSWRPMMDVRMAGWDRRAPQFTQSCLHQAYVLLPKPAFRLPTKHCASQHLSLIAPRRGSCRLTEEPRLWCLHTAQTVIYHS